MTNIIVQNLSNMFNQICCTVMTEIASKEIKKEDVQNIQFKINVQLGMMKNVKKYRLELIATNGVFSLSSVSYPKFDGKDKEARGAKYIFNAVQNKDITQLQLVNQAMFEFTKAFNNWFAIK